MREAILLVRGGRLKSAWCTIWHALLRKMAVWTAVVSLLCAGQLPAQNASEKGPDNSNIANFIDIADKAGLTAVNVFGGVDTKKYIIETTGAGGAIFDYDNDGWPGIFVVNGTTPEGFPADQVPTNPPSPNNHDGTFTD